MELRSDIRPIIGAHLETIRNSGRESVPENVTHYVVPMLLGLGFAFWHGLTGAPFPFGNLIAGLAILFGFFLALTTFVFGLRRQVTGRLPMTDLRAPRLIDELFVNCEYAVIISGASTMLAVLFDVIGWGYLGSILIAFLAHLFLLVMMCLKRLNRAYEIHKDDLRADARQVRSGSRAA